MQTVIIFVFCLLVAVTAHVVAPFAQPDYIAPKATSYIYRSDNGGPASLIQLGGPHYQQPHAFAPPLPIAQPIIKYEPAIFEPIRAYDLQPAPLPYIANQPIEDEPIAIAEDDHDDESDEDSSGEYISSEDDGIIGHGHAFEKGSGSHYGDQHHSAHGEKGGKGYHTKQHHQKGSSGKYGKEHDEGHYSQEEGEKTKHHNEADAYGAHHEAGKSYKGGDHGHKKHHSKGEEVTGYHKIFHKDEFKKDHDFYDVADNSGHFNKHGYAKEHHGSEEAGHKKAGHHNSAIDAKEYGKKGYHAAGHHNDDNANHSDEEGSENYYNHKGEFAKKGGNSHEKAYGYEDDDEEY